MVTQFFGSDRRSSHWTWFVLSIACLPGCATWNELAHNVAQPWRATSNAVARTNDYVEDSLESLSTRKRNPANLPAHQLSQTAPARPTPRTMQSSIQPAGSQSTAPVISPNALTPAPADVELLPAPPVSQTSATAPANNVVSAVPTSAPVSTPTTSTAATGSSRPAAPPISRPKPLPSVAATAAAPTADMPANPTWCKVRIRNVSHQPATQVAVIVSSPVNASLVSKEADKISPAAAGKMEFAPVAQVGPNEEVILIVGMATTAEQANRLRVQVRDGQGGSNQDVQARWHVAIEAAE